MRWAYDVDLIVRPSEEGAQLDSWKVEQIDTIASERRLLSVNKHEVAAHDFEQVRSSALRREDAPIGYWKTLARGIVKRWAVTGLSLPFAMGRGLAGLARQFRALLLARLV
jgi:hypothetical protein